MSSLPQTIYLEGGPEPIFAVFHPAEPQRARDTAVILCPPFGWDEVCSYRSRREWAQRLAEAGYASIRFSFPGTGDSGGTPRDPHRLEAWTAAAAIAGRWIREACGASRTVAIGMGLGGLVAYRAAALGAPIDDLVMWGTPTRARALVRQLRAFSKLEAAQFFEGLEPPQPLAPGELEAGGFLLSTQTVEDLDGLDLSSMSLPDPSSRRVLLLERDGITVDVRLREHLEQSGVAVTVSPGNGYAAMTSHPQSARAPLEVIECVAAWLQERATPMAPGADTGPPWTAEASTSAQIRVGKEATVTETPFFVQQPFGLLTGVLTEPDGARAGALCVVLLNAGAIRRIGPSRMWVQAARRWAARGVPTLRLDIAGLGESDGDPRPYTDDAGLYVPELVPQVLATLDALQEQGMGNRFVLGGLCAGAYWAFHAALQDPRVCAAWMVNPRVLVWDLSLSPARDFRALVLEAPSWAKIRRSYSAARMRALALWMLRAPQRAIARLRSSEKRGRAATREVDSLLHQLRTSDKRALLLFSDDEPLDKELARSGQLAGLEQSPNVTIERLLVRDHTLRPNWAQGQALQALDRALDRELTASRLPQPAAPLSHT